MRSSFGPTRWRPKRGSGPRMLSTRPRTQPGFGRTVEGARLEAPGGDRGAADLARGAEQKEANRATEAAAEANAQAQSAVVALTQAEQRARRLNEQLARAREERAALATRSRLILCCWKGRRLRKRRFRPL